MLSEIKTRYSKSLKRSETFLEDKKNTSKSTSITSTRELCLLRNQAECPICAIKFSGKNHNTEHIHPRALGGLNVDENKIQMCTACNNSRNLTMQSMLGTPPYYKNYQSIKADVDEFILWSEVTADEGFLAGSVFPRAQEIFTEARFANTEPPMPQRAYGRFSTWDKDSLPNLKFYQTPIRTTPIEHNQSKRKIGLVERFFDRLFGYEPKKPETETKKEDKKSANKIKPHRSSKQQSSIGLISLDEGIENSKDETLNEPKYNSTTSVDGDIVLEVRTHLSEFMERKQREIGSFPLHEIMDLLKTFKNGKKPQVSWSKILKQLGITTSGFWEAMPEVLKEMGYSFQLHTTGGVDYIIMDESYIIIKGFSTAGKAGKSSLSWPSKPNKMVEIIEFVLTKREICYDWTELRDSLYASKIESKKRTTPVYKLLHKLSNPEGEEKIVWQNIPDLIEILKNLESLALETYSSRDYQWFELDQHCTNLVKIYFEIAKQEL
jgi:hypothetical protein